MKKIFGGDISSPLTLDTFFIGKGNGVNGDTFIGKYNGVSGNTFIGGGTGFRRLDTTSGGVTFVGELALQKEEWPDN